MALNLAQRIGQEFRTLRNDELSPLQTDVQNILSTMSTDSERLAAIQAVTDAFESADGDLLAAITSSGTKLDAMFVQDGATGDITFKGNLLPETSELSIGSAEHVIKDLFVSANTIHLGENTKLEGTTITVDGGENPTSLTEVPTIIGSAIVAKPFVYNPGTGNVTVRPSISFQDVAGNSYPISFDTVNNKFSFDALGNYGQGTIVAKDIEVGGTITLDGYNFGETFVLDGGIRVDGNTSLGYDSSNTITLRGTTAVEAPIVFEEGASLGDGNDNVVVNSGMANTFTVVAQNFSVDASGNVTCTDINDMGNYSDFESAFDLANA